MIKVKFKKTVSLLMAAALSIGVLPSAIQRVRAVEGSVNVIYSNDFEDTSKLPKGKTSADLVNDVNGSKAVAYDFQFNPASTWDEKPLIEIDAEYANAIPAGSKLQLDLLLPKNSSYSGVLKVQGATKLGSGWTWTQSNTIPEVPISDFTATGDYLLKTVEISFGSEIASQQGLHEIIFKLAGYQCDYQGKLYIDNVRLVTEVPQQTTSQTFYVNDFEDVSKLPEGKAAADLIGGINGSKAVKYNYKFDSTSTWDQKGDINIYTEYADTLPVGTKLQMDIVLPKASTFAGKIKVKGAVKLGSGWTWTEGSSLPEIGISDFIESGDYLINTVEIPFSNNISTNKGLHQIVFQFAGYQCDYEGLLYIDNVKLLTSSTSTASKYVEKSVQATVQEKVAPTTLTLPSSVKIVDANATSKTAKLYAYLRGIGASDYVIYGHQNDIHHKAVRKEEGTNSDTKDITGSIAGVLGIDALSLTGDELTLGTGDTDLVTKAANISIDAAKEGAIITMSAHMPNFELVANKGKINGKYDYTTYSAGTTTGNVVPRIMPGGDLNEAYIGYLDMIASYGKQLEAKGVPVLFRPFHENNGSWFWWGAAYCDPASYKNLFRYTVEYLRDTKGVHNFLYVYSPNGPFSKEEDYLSRYPGDDYIDVVAFDYYHDNPSTTDAWIDSFKKTIQVVDSIASKHNKLSTVSEVGIRPMTVTKNPRPDWFNEIMNTMSASNMPYFMTWANWGEDQFYQPYMVTETTGHELINNFMNFYNEKNSVFADGIADYSTISVAVEKSATTGYVLSPTSGSRILEPTTLRASVKNEVSSVAFVLKNNSGEGMATLQASKKDGVYTAAVTQADLDKLGSSAGTIELIIDGKVYDRITALFNIKEEPKNPAVVDTFEGYYGETALLQKDWTTNKGPGCSIEPALSNEASKFRSGSYGLAFNYTITGTKGSEGWAGITKSMEADWSDYDALRLWIKPDGKGQKLVVQITSNGEDFEVQLPEFAATTEAKLLTLKFSDFVGKNKGTFNAAKIQRVGLWCNTIVPQGQNDITVESVMYFDDIKAVNTAAPVIASIDNIDSEVVEGEAYSLPKEVNAKFSDNTSKPVKITWSPAVVNTSKAGTYSFKGIVEDYDKQVALTLSVKVKPVVTTDTQEADNTQNNSTLPKTGSVGFGDVVVIGLIVIAAGIFVIRRKQVTE